MTSILLTPYDGAILGPIAKLLGWIMNGIYVFMSDVCGIENVGLSIILLTFVIYTCLLPLTYKQQKFSKLSQKMQPEIKAIQEKYKNRSDQASVMAMNQETQMVYEKYGISPTGTCVQMLIQMPILFALYRVFYNVPAYISAVKEKFVVVADEIYNYDGFAEIMTKIQTDFKIALSTRPDFVVSETNTVEEVKNFIVDILYKVPSVESLIVPNADGEVYFKGLESVNQIVNSGTEAFYEFNHFFGLNISDTPWNTILTSFSAKNYLLVFAALMIPVLSYLTQVANSKLMEMKNDNKKNTQGDMMAQQMKTMNTMMPIMSLVMCFSVPVGLGLYWVISAVYRSIQQMAINKYIENLDLDDIIKQNQEKAKAKREKMGISENQIRNAAMMNTRTVQNKASVSVSAEKEAQLKSALEAKANAKQGSLAAKANMVREFNERNSRK
ncbi:MAG: YidC/Oxa1 family membrane protein insertase [Lachnospiraceae bacterium]|nr:YidC/Oxa1 family membrane protein insertase [Lachnospiraceae bacterium]